MHIERKDSEADADEQDELRSEYGEAELTELLTNGVRGKYVERYRRGVDGMLYQKFHSHYELIELAKED